MQISTARDIGLAVRSRRRELGLSQERLAERAGVGRQWLVEVEKGKATAALGLVLRLFKALDLRLFAEPRGKASSGALSPLRPEIDLDDIIARARQPN
jgi:y4mF family transcriptional regulator